MKKELLVIVLLTLVVEAGAIKPRWVNNPPQSNSADYEYVVIHQYGASEEEALSRADRELKERVMNDLFGTMSKEQSAKDMQSNNVRFQRCAYYVTRADDKSFSVYCLYQYAKRANWFAGSQPCAVTGVMVEKNTRDCDSRPKSWGIYETDEYISVFKDVHIDESDNLDGEISKLTKEAKRDLALKVGISDTSRIFILNVNAKNNYNKKRKELSVVAYIEKKKIVEWIEHSVKTSLQDVETYIANAESFDELKNWERAEMECERAEKQMKVATERLKKMKEVVGMDESFSTLQSKYNGYRKSVLSYKNKFSEKNTGNRIAKFKSLLRTASRAEHLDKQYGIALQYYYASQAYMSTLYSADTISFTEIGGVRHTNLSSWLSIHIGELLSMLKIECVNNPKRKGEAIVYFCWPDGRQAVGVQFKYNDSYGESDWMMAFNGKEYIQFAGGESMDKVEIILDYKYPDEWVSDLDIQKMVENCKISYDDKAKRIVQVKEGTNEQLPKALSDQDVVVSKITSKELGINNTKAKEYTEIVSQVCEAIDKDSYSQVREMFSDEGWKSFKYLTDNATVRVKNCGNCKCVKFCDEVYVRSVEMELRYASGKRILENVVFVFDKNGKIDGVQFAMDDVTMRDLMSRSDSEGWTDTIKYTIANFIENYRTAYCLKNLNYIEDVFADDAVIIVGRYIKKPEMKDKRDYRIQNVEYLNLDKVKYLERMARIFKTNEWINIKFNKVDISYGERSGYYGIELQQAYRSSNYGDDGYLFLIVDFDDAKHPMIKLRAWTPNGTFSWGDYEKMINAR